LLQNPSPTQKAAGSIRPLAARLTSDRNYSTLPDPLVPLLCVPGFPLVCSEQSDCLICLSVSGRET